MAWSLDSNNDNKDKEAVKPNEPANTFLKELNTIKNTHLFNNVKPHFQHIVFTDIIIKQTFKIMLSN